MEKTKVSGLKFTSGRISEPWYLPMASYGLNRALGGGLKSGRFHLLAGPKSSTKSTQALKCIAIAQAMGKRCLYIDSEKTFETAYAEQCGVDVDSLMLAQEGTNIAEELMVSLLPALAKKDFEVIVIDSINQIQLNSMISGAEDKSMAPDARSAKFVLTKLLNVLDRSMQIILIAHASYQKVGQNFMLQPAVGEKVKHLMSTMISFTANTGKDNFRELDNAQKVMWRINKAKQAVWPLDGEYYFHKPTAIIDEPAELVSIAQSLDIVTGGAWKEYKGQKFHGEQQLLAAVREDINLYKTLKTDIELIDSNTRHLFAGGVDSSSFDLGVQDA